jgi:hypothetical protein
MRCDMCSKQMLPGELCVSFETGRQRFSAKMKHVYFQLCDEVMQHRECSVWNDMTPHFVTEAKDVDNCVLCTTSIKEDDEMLRIRLGVMGSDSEIVEMHEKFYEVYMHPDCASCYIDEDALPWNT